VIDIYYDYRAIDSFANEITPGQELVVEIALQVWEDATGGKINFVRNTSVPDTDIIIIGTGSLETLGFLSVPGGTLGLGGGTYTHNADHTITGGVTWMDSADNWDDIIGNDDPDGGFDYFTVAAQEIGHALGLGHTNDLAGPDLMDGIYVGEQTAASANDVEHIQSVYGAATGGDNIYDVQVTVTDAGFLTDVQDIAVTVTDVNEAPTVTLINTTTTLPENTDTSSALKVADIVVSDDALGTNVLSLTGTDVGLFEIVGTELRLKVDTVLDMATNPTLDVTVAVNDASVEPTPNDTDSLAITITESESGIAFAVNYLDAAGEGFFDSVLRPARQAAFEFAMGIWPVLIDSSYVGEIITIDATMDPLGGSPSSAILGQAGSPFINREFGAGLADTWYGDALANHLNGADLNPGSAEIVATFNSDVDNSTVLGGIDWYYGLDELGGNDIDFVSVVLHEFGHGLNFFDLIQQNGRWFAQDLPGIYDRLLEIGDGTDLVDMNNSNRRKATVSNDLFWSGPNGFAGNSDTRPQLYAPNPLESGSSKSHLDETVHGGELMSPFYSGPDHTPSDMEFGMLADMGWSVSSLSASASAQVSESRGNSKFKRMPNRDIQSWTTDLTSPKFQISAEEGPSGLLERPTPHSSPFEQNLFIAGWFSGQSHQGSSELSQRADTGERFTTDQILLTASNPRNDDLVTSVGRQKISAVDTRLSASHWELLEESNAVDESSDELAFDVEQLDDFFSSIVDPQESSILLPF
jgi:hypothetical protein